MKDLFDFRKVCVARASRRVQAGSVARDLFHFLVRHVLYVHHSAHADIDSCICQNNEDGAEAVSPPMPIVISDAALAVIAGSDTTAGCLSCALFFLLSYPDIHAKLRAEIDQYYPPGEDPCDTKHYPKMAYLDAVM